MLHPLEVPHRRAAHQLVVKRRLAAVADRTERVDEQRGGDARRMRGEHVEEQVAAPRVADDRRALPAQRVEHRDDIGDLSGHVIRRAGRRGREPALLVDRNAMTGGELVDERLEIRPRQAGAAMQQQDALPVTRQRAAEEATRNLG